MRYIEQGSMAVLFWWLVSRAKGHLINLKQPSQLVLTKKRTWNEDRHNCPYLRSLFEVVEPAWNKRVSGGLAKPVSLLCSRKRKQSHRLSWDMDPATAKPKSHDLDPTCSIFDPCLVKLVLEYQPSNIYGLHRWYRLRIYLLWNRTSSRLTWRCVSQAGVRGGSLLG